jgi:hypothetical protein
MARRCGPTNLRMTIEAGSVQYSATGAGSLFAAIFANAPGSAGRGGRRRPEVCRMPLVFVLGSQMLLVIKHVRGVNLGLIRTFSAGLRARLVWCTIGCNVTGGSAVRHRVPRSFLLAHPHVVLDLACLTEGRRRCAPPRSYPRNSRLRLSSPAARPFLAQNKKVAPWLPFTACRPLRGAGRPPPVCRQPSRPRWARPGRN